jgi:DNA-binding NarL/FixJ family response regulator
MTGLDAAPLLRKVVPDARIILFTVQEGHEVEQLACAAGIHAVVSKNQAASKLILQAQALLALMEQDHHSTKLRSAS